MAYCLHKMFQVEDLRTCINLLTLLSSPFSCRSSDMNQSKILSRSKSKSFQSSQSPVQTTTFHSHLDTQDQWSYQDIRLATQQLGTSVALGGLSRFKFCHPVHDHLCVGDNISSHCICSTQSFGSMFNCCWLWKDWREKIMLDHESWQFRTTLRDSSTLTNDRSKYFYCQHSSSHPRHEQRT